MHTASILSAFLGLVIVQDSLTLHRQRVVILLFYNLLQKVIIWLECRVEKLLSRDTSNLWLPLHKEL